MRAYVTTTGIMFGHLALAHLRRAVEEGTHPLRPGLERDSLPLTTRLPAGIFDFDVGGGCDVPEAANALRPHPL